jgi:hypothetical protein
MVSMSFWRATIRKGCEAPALGPYDAEMRKNKWVKMTFTLPLSQKTVARWYKTDRQECFDPVTGRTRVRAALALATNLYKWKDLLARLRLVPAYAEIYPVRGTASLAQVAHPRLQRYAIPRHASSWIEQNATASMTW